MSEAAGALADPSGTVWAPWPVPPVPSGLGMMSKMILSGRDLSGETPSDAAEVIQAQIVARAPGDHVIGARRVAADPKAAHSHSAFISPGEAPAEHVDAADRCPTIGSLRRAKGVAAAGAGLP